MADDSKGGEGNDANANKNQNLDNSGNRSDDGKGTDPKKTENSGAQGFDTSKIGDEDFDKIFDDPRVYKHPRFKNLNERAKKADALEKERQEAEEKRLKEQGKFKELADTNAKKAEEAENKWKTAVVDNKIIAEASKLGTADLEAVLKLIDRSQITIGEDGSITGADTAVKALLEAKPYLKGKAGDVTVGGGTNPGGEGSQTKRFKASQLQDPKFYAEHEKEILEAIKNNQVENDLPR